METGWIEADAWLKVILGFFVNCKLSRLIPNWSTKGINLDWNVSIFLSHESKLYYSKNLANVSSIYKCLEPILKGKSCRRPRRVHVTAIGSKFMDEIHITNASSISRMNIMLWPLLLSFLFWLLFWWPNNICLSIYIFFRFTLPKLLCFFLWRNHFYIKIRWWSIEDKLLAWQRKLVITK